MQNKDDICNILCRLESIEHMMNLTDKDIRDMKWVLEVKINTFANMCNIIEKSTRIIFWAFLLYILVNIIVIIFK